MVSTDPRALLSLSALVQEHGLDNLAFINPLAADASPRDALRMMRYLQSVCPPLDDESLYADRLWRMLSRDFRVARSIFDMTALRAYAVSASENAIARILHTWFDEDSLRAVASATGM